jgi:phosphoadenosine phosphosulfate reductase
MQRQDIQLFALPLAWSVRKELMHSNYGQIEEYFIQQDLPRHPLIAQGYPSIGCSPCTTQVAPGEDPRSGRWKGWDKTECGIHKPGEEPFL